tara:strand:+ start:50 stop:3469 length:3420 start_codon:yes stop_codon:yes gene_type:complete
MAQTNFTFNRNSFTSNSPSWSGPQEEYSSNLRFHTVTKTLKLNDSSYGRGTFTVTVPSGIDLGLITFNTPNGGIVSMSDELNGVYELCNFEGAIIAKVFTQDGTNAGGSKTYYVVVNGDPDTTSRYLNVSIALAKAGSIPSSSKTVTLTYTCPPSGGNLNEYTVGVHAYSAYDAKAGSSTLTTKLYSATVIGSWSTSSTGTSVYSSPYLNNPALPYFYGYNGKVYRVGDPWSRSYGIKFRYEIRVTWHWFFKRRTRSKRVTLGPLESLNLGTNGNQPTSEACIEPTMRNVGKIRQIYENGTSVPIPSQPQQYRYYMGYDVSNRRNSNDSVFTHYSLAQKKHIPITGLMHVFMKHTRGIINGFKRAWDGDVNWTAIAGGAGVGLISSLFGESIITGIAEFFSSINGPLPSFEVMFGAQAAATLGTILLVLAILYIIWQLFAFFSPKTHHYKEDCKQFLHHFTTTPYINEGNTLYRDDNLSIVNNGYYCDGVYYYQQSSGAIASNTKTLSSTNAFVSETSPQQFLYSLEADNPTLVVDWQKLVLLPYTSGKPIPYCGGSTIYYSAELTHTVTTQCCELEDCNTPIVITLPYGTATSCTSQADADAEATTQFQAAINYAEDHSVYNATLSDEFIGQLDVSFTHEIKEEDNPTSMALYFDARSGSDAPIETPLFYDFSGCQKALPGYYAISSSSYPKHYYKVEDGEVAAIYTQSAANSTTTTTGQTIIKTNEDKSSNWYLKSNTKDPLFAYISNTNDRTFNVNSLLTTSTYTLSAGRIISGSYTNGAFEKYNTFNSNGITTVSTTEQGTGWYAPLNPWQPFNEDLFFYQNALTSWVGGTQRFIIDGFGEAQLCAGGNTGTTYYHDGESSSPTLGDRIYDTNDITDSTADGYIKYTTDLYMTITGGIMVASTSCSGNTNFSGSHLSTGSINTAKSRATNQILYEHNGSTSTLAVGDTISIFGGSAVGEGFIRYENDYETTIAHTDSNGEVLQIFNEDLANGWVSNNKATILADNKSTAYGYNDGNPSGIGPGTLTTDLDYKYPTGWTFGDKGWKVVGVIWDSAVDKIELTFKYPDQADIGNKPDSFDDFVLTGGNNTYLSRTNGVKTEFSNGGNDYYRYVWSNISTNPFNTTSATFAYFRNLSI